MSHLTVAHGDAAQVAQAHVELTQRLRVHGAIHGLCDGFVLMEKTAGGWRERHAFALAPIGR